jgi:hypothetical protein
MTFYQKTLAELAPELDPLHMETLAYAVGSTLNGMPAEFFDDIAALARRMGPEKLARFHAREIGAA